MSAKGMHKKKHGKDKSSDTYVVDKHHGKKKHRKEETSGKDKHHDKKKRRKDEISDIKAGDKIAKTQNLEDNRQVDFVYYDPAVIEEAEVFQVPVQDSQVLDQNDEDQ